MENTNIINIYHCKSKMYTYYKDNGIQFIADIISFISQNLPGNSFISRCYFCYNSNNQHLAVVIVRCFLVGFYGSRTVSHNLEWVFLLPRLYKRLVNDPVWTLETAEFVVWENQSVHYPFSIPDRI